VRGEGDLHVAGRVEGGIDIDGEVVFEQSAIVKGDVSGQRVVVRGAVAEKQAGLERIIQLLNSSVPLFNLSVPLGNVSVAFCKLRVPL